MFCRYLGLFQVTVSGLKKTERILRNREEDPIESSDNDTVTIDEQREPSNVFSALRLGIQLIKHLLNILRLTTIGAVRSVLLQFEPDIFLEKNKNVMEDSLD